MATTHLEGIWVLTTTLERMGMATTWDGHHLGCQPAPERDRSANHHLGGIKVLTITVEGQKCSPTTHRNRGARHNFRWIEVVTTTTLEWTGTATTTTWDAVTTLERRGVLTIT